jgi:hypothetical protein
VWPVLRLSGQHRPRRGAPPHAIVYAGLTRPSAFTIGPDGAFYVSNNGASAGVGEVLRIQP